MTRVMPVIIAAAALLVVLDIIGALARQPLGFPYLSLGVVSLLTYFTVGLMGTWRAHFRLGVLAAVMVGFLDAPLAAWMIGPGPVGQTITEPGIFAYGITVVTLTAAGAGLIGACAGSWLQRRRGLHGSRAVPL